MKKHERGHGIRKIWRPSNNLRDRPRDWCANRYVEIYFCFLIRCCVRGVVGSFHSWRGRVIFRAIKVKATVSRSDRSISFCSTLFILSFSLSFIFSNSNDFASNSLFHRDSRMFVSFDRDERIELIRTKSINLSCFNAFFFFFLLFSACNFL